MNKIIHSTIYHKRYRPRVNEFKYRGMQVRINIKDLDTMDSIAINRFGLFSIYTRDHAYREDSNLSISEVYRSWAVEKLKSVHMAEVGDIELQTIPRVLGYGFNPVSFWFCYEGKARDSNLLAVICEVNNTFGDSHNYILTEPSHESLNKEFHVSPFYPRQGRYEFSIGENIIIKYFSEDQHKLDFLAGVSPYQDFELNKSNLLKSFFKLPFFSFQVILLIHWQALKLFLKTITFYTRPIPLTHKDTYGTDHLSS